MKKLLARAKALALDPRVRPVEVWALRAIIAWLAVRLGIDAKNLVP